MEQTDKYLKNLLFLDVKTVPIVPSFTQLSPAMQDLWVRKAANISAGADAARLFEERASLYAEFGRVAAVGVGYFYAKEGQALLRVKALDEPEEAETLLAFKKLIETRFHPGRLRLVAHNGKDFDYPFLCRRMLICGVGLPSALELSGKKQWQVAHLDTMELWRFGDSRHFASRELLAAIFGLQQEDTAALSGTQMALQMSQWFHQEQNREAIRQRCAQDVALTARLFLRLRSLPDLPPEHIEYV